MDFKIYRFDEVVSTSLTLKDMDAPVGTVAVAKVQTGGYGRNGRSFSSPENGLYMSAVFGAETIFDKLFVPVKAAVAVNSVLSEYLPCGIKWPNDIVANGKKLCGILAESFKNNVIVGIGVNVNTPSQYFDVQNLPYATSLFAQTGRRHDADSILSGILSKFGMETDREIIVSQYKKNCITLNKEIRVLQGNSEYNAKAVDLTENGELIVLKDGKALVVNSGEVSIRGSEYV